MEKIHKFKKEVLTFNIYSEIDLYPGNPDYIGKDRDIEFKESVRKGNYEDHKGRIDREGYELMKEVVASDSVFHYYIETISDIALNSIYDEAQFSIGNLSLDGLMYALQILESYNYNEFFEELDLLSSKFESGKTGKVDEYRFKAIFKKHFNYRLEAIGKISRMFVSSFRCELKKRIKYLEALKEDINKMIAIKMKGVANNVELINNNNTVELDYKGIFQNVAELAEDPTRMKAYFIRQQRTAERDHFYEKDDFYKGLLKIASQEREKFKEYLESKSYETPVDNEFHIEGFRYIHYNNEEIDLIEKIIHEIRNEGKVEQSKTDKYSHYTALQWGAIFYYVNSKILSDEISIESKLSAFKKKHNIKHTFKTFKVEYYNAYKMIIETNDYPAKKLKPIVPFFQQYYKKIVVDLKNDIKVLEEYEAENQ